MTLSSLDLSCISAHAGRIPKVVRGSEAIGGAKGVNSSEKPNQCEGTHKGAETVGAWAETCLDKSMRVEEDLRKYEHWKRRRKARNAGSEIERSQRRKVGPRKRGRT
jgi:hypothetical protein